jgi:hypothetical protein
MNLTGLKLAIAASTFALCLLGGGFFLWAKSEHRQEEQRQLAQEFLRLLQTNQFVRAHELTTRNGPVGRTAAELELISNRELCAIERLAYTYPFQSNGNRLRRWVSGVEIEMPQVHVEFVGAACLIGVTVVRTEDKQWRVSKFSKHAG